jgi:hypothetical protein
MGILLNDWPAPPQISADFLLADARHRNARQAF